MQNKMKDPAFYGLLARTSEFICVCVFWTRGYQNYGKWYQSPVIPKQYSAWEVTSKDPFCFLMQSL